MLTNLDFLKAGNKFPPDSEYDRLEMYTTNKALFETKHADVYKEDFKRIERVIGNFSDVVSYPVILNFQKLMSLKIADLLVGEPPQITAGDAGSAEQQTVDSINDKSDLINTLYNSLLDVSRYGDGLLYIREDIDGGVIDLTQPPLWFPVVSADNVKKILYHVLAWTVETKDSYNNPRKRLKIQIHENGQFEEREHEFDDGKTIGKQTMPPRMVKTKIKGNAIIQISNTTTSDRATGLDDYTDVDSIIAELMVRVGQVARILDKHASPSMSGPQTALERDEVTGEWRLKAGNYFTRMNNDDPDVKYITWDGQLEANFKEIEKLTNFLYTISEMGSALFGDMSANVGQVPSGTALRRLMIAPLAKVNRIRMRLDKKVKEAIISCSQIGGKGIMDLTNTPITITWRDGLPADPIEEATIMKTRTGDKATMSQYRALKTYDGMTDADAEEELARIQDEEAAITPTNPAPFSGGEPSEPIDDEE